MKIGSTAITSIKIGSIPITKVYKGDVINWGQIPNSGDALFWLDGTILLSGSDYYFVDQTANARNFLITDYDFNTDWTVGFPYKSAATISAPAGDAVLIAADINNYLYDSGGTPNAIPVVSLFQDVDYENKLFCRHADQVVDGNGVETYEPRVLEMVLYANVKSGADLVTCQSYYGVPVEALTAVKWIDPVNGLDTNSGTKVSPWQTLPKSTTSATAGDTIYIKTGECDLSTGIWNSSTKLLYHKCIGFNLTRSSVSRSTFIYPHGGTFERFNIDGTGLTTLFLSITNITVNLINVKVNLGGTVISNNTNGHNISIINCVFTNLTAYAVQSFGDPTINTCYINIPNITVIGNKRNLTNISLINSKLSAGYLQISVAGYSTTQINNIIIKGCNIVTTNYLFSITDTQDVIISNNIITCGGSSLWQIDAPTPSKNTVTIANNTITSTSISTVFPIVNKNLVCQNNYVIHNAVSGSTINMYSLGVETLTVDISNNSFNCLGEGGPCAIGDGTFAVTDKITGIIYNNKWLGNAYYGGGIGGHGLSIWANKGVSIKHNYIHGWKIAIVLKGGNCDYATNDIVGNKIINGYLTTRGVSNVPIYNNTFIMNDKSQVCIDLLTDELGNESLNAQIKNNIFINNFSTNLTALVQVENNSTPVIDYNILYNTDSTKIGWYQGAYKTFSQWQALGYDVHSILLTTEQLASIFNDIATFDLSLKVSSMAIGAGVDLGAVYDDGLDASTDWGTDSELPVVVTKQQSAAWDIGAYVH